MVLIQTNVCQMEMCVVSSCSVHTIAREMKMQFPMEAKGKNVKMAQCVAAASEIFVYLRISVVMETVSETVSR